jgi:hypothetical protein
MLLLNTTVPFTWGNQDLLPYLPQYLLNHTSGTGQYGTLYINLIFIINGN